MTASDTESYVFNHVMLRVKDIDKSLKFYREALGMTLVRESHSSDFSLYFMAKVSGIEAEELAAIPTEEERVKVMRLKHFYLELTHNHGTENEDGMVYKNGNCDQSRGWGHLAFTVPDLQAACLRMDSLGVSFKKRPEDGMMRNIAFLYDPDMYWIELIQR